MFITTWQKRASLPEHQRTLKVRVDGQCLEIVFLNKLLGIIINHNLSWEEHINSIFQKKNIKLALLRGIKVCLHLEQCKIYSNANISNIYTTGLQCEVTHNLVLAQKRVA